MAGLRELKKQKTQAAILRAASLLFQQQGYEQTTMLDVSKACEIGVGTLYNYYPSKVDLLLAIFEQNIEADLDMFMRVMHNESLHGLDKVKQVVALFATNICKHPKAILREMMKVALSKHEDGATMTMNIFATDQHFLLLVRQCVQMEVALPQHFPLDQAMTTFYHAIRSEIMAFIVTDEQLERDVLANIDDHIDFIFKIPT